MVRPTINNSITDGLGYCCEWLFFRLYKRPTEISARLGFSKRMCAMHKSNALAQETCPGLAKCQYRGNVVKLVKKRA